LKIWEKVISFTACAC